MRGRREEVEREREWRVKGLRESERIEGERIVVSQGMVGDGWENDGIDGQ